MPAQFTASVSLPNFALACSTAALTSPSLDTSVLMNSARSPSFSCAALPASALTSSMATCPPALTSFSATANPRPETPPLMIALAFSNFICFSRYLMNVGADYRCRHVVSLSPAGGSGFPFHHLPGDPPQDVRPRPERGECIDRRLVEFRQAPARGLQAEQGREGGHAMNGVAARSLAQRGAVTFDVQQVIPYLEGQPDGVTVFR